MLTLRLQRLHHLPTERDHRLGAGGEAGRTGAGNRISNPAGNTTDLMARPEKIIGATYKLRWTDSEHAMYVTVNDIELDGVRRPFEVFVYCKNLEHYAWVVALTRMISAVFRRGGEVAFVAEELKQAVRPARRSMDDGRYVGSLVAAIGDIIERHMIDTGFLARQSRSYQGRHGHVTGRRDRAWSVLPEAQSTGLASEAGCLSCAIAAGRSAAKN